jgi:hypothetical protein
MSFEIKNGPPTYQITLIKTFRKSLDNFMKISFDNFKEYNDMESHSKKVRLCFQKCTKYGTNLNLDKCAFMIFSRMILGLLFPKKGNYQIQRKCK